MLQSAQNQIKNKKIKKTGNVAKKKATVTTEKMRKTNMMHNHPYSETKELSDSKMRTTPMAASKRMGTTGNLSKNTTQNIKYNNKDVRSGEDLKYQDNGAGSLQEKGEIGDRISQEKADKKVKEHQEKAKGSN